MTKYDVWWNWIYFTLGPAYLIFATFRYPKSERQEKKALILIAASVLLGMTSCLFTTFGLW